MIYFLGLALLFCLSAAGRNKRNSRKNKGVSRSCALEEATHCTLSGDPHFTMFNKVRHDFQGYSQYYYAKPCCGVDDDEMPFAIMGKHYQWGTRSLSLLDYITLVLTDEDGEIYYVHISSAISCYYAADDAISTLNPTLYDENIAACTDLDDLVTEIGDRFVLRVQTRVSGVVSIVLQIDGEHNVAMRMTPDKRASFIYDGRLRLHTLVIDPFEEYKCYSCGLCGNFNNAKSQFETCDGGNVTVVAGAGSANTFAHDITGNTYEQEYCDLYAECADEEEDYECSKGGKVVKDVCSAKLYKAAKALCTDHVESVWECCALLDDDGGCNLAIQNCAVDACAAVDSVDELNVELIAADLFDDATAICEGYIEDEEDIAAEMLFMAGYQRPGVMSASYYMIFAATIAVFVLALACMHKQQSEYKIVPDHPETV